MPLTFVLQCLVTLCLLLFGAGALLVAGQRRGLSSFHRAAWLLTGIAFMAHGVNKGVLNVLGYLTLRAGRGSPVDQVYEQVRPVLDHSRTLLLAAFFVALAGLALPRQAPGRRYWWLACGVMAAGLLGGALLGYLQAGPAATHYAWVASLDLVELVMVMVALGVMLATNRADRHLWGALAVYGASLALGVSWFAAFAFPDEWTPSNVSLQYVRLFFRVAMVAVVLRRLQLARRGIAVPGLTERRGQRPTALASLH